MCSKISLIFRFEGGKESISEGDGERTDECYEEMIRAIMFVYTPFPQKTSPKVERVNGGEK